MQRRFSASTAILVVLLLGVLYAVGRVVNPPTKGGEDHDHDDTPAAQQTAPPTAAAKPDVAPPRPGSPAKAPDAGPSEMMKSKMMAMAEKAKKEHAHDMPTSAAHRSHAAEGMDPSLWQERNMGQVAVKPDAKK